MSDRQIFIIHDPLRPGVTVAATIFVANDKEHVKQVFWNAYVTWLTKTRERADAEAASRAAQGVANADPL